MMSADRSAYQQDAAYQQDEVHQILEFAIARQADAGELSREQVFEIADELGISRENLLAAEQDWWLQKQENRERQSFNLHRREKWRKKVIQYLLANSFLVMLDLMLAGGALSWSSWSLYIVVFWGFSLALDSWRYYQTTGEDYERSFSRWRRKRQLKHSMNRLVDKVLKT